MTHKLVRKVQKVRYHRNGVAGVGFFRVDFRSVAGEDLIAIVESFDEPPSLSIPCYVVNPADASCMYRGDAYAPEVYRAIEAAGDAAFRP